MFVLACVSLSVVPFPLVEEGVIEEERAEDFGGQYHEPEPEDPYHEQELPEGFEDGKSNLFPFDHIYPSFQT